jgi:predicted metal-dependent enzyme (double-stranded beta helix superfamily)
MNAQGLIDAVRHVKQQQQKSLTGLTAALTAFVTDPANRPVELPSLTSGLYTRILLNAPNDDYQIVVVSWSPGGRSPIHDHDETAGAVAALVGTTLETKHQIVCRSESKVELAALDTIRLTGQTITPILPDETTQLHDMVNDTDEWSATVHVYLTAIHEFRIYAPDPDGSFSVQPRTLWFDAVDAGRHWPTRA